MVSHRSMSCLLTLKLFTYRSTSCIGVNNRLVQNNRKCYGDNHLRIKWTIFRKRPKYLFCSLLKSFNVNKWARTLMRCHTYKSRLTLYYLLMSYLHGTILLL